MSEDAQVCLNTDPEFIDGWVPRMAQVLRNRGDADNATLLEVLKERHDSAIAELNTRSPAWRDIESAPRDGRWLLVTWSDEPHRCEGMRYESANWYWWEGDCTSNPPTHWMPLPLPPEEGK